MENIKPLVISQVVSVEKSNNNLTVNVKNLKRERSIHPKELSPMSMARSYSVNPLLDFFRYFRQQSFM